MAKKIGFSDKKNGKPRKALGHRSKVKSELQNRIKSQKEHKEKKKMNEEIFTLLNREKLAELPIKTKAEILEKLYNLVLSYPEQNYDKLSLMFLFLEDDNPKLVERAFKRVSNLLHDILPSYKIKSYDNDFTNNEKAHKKHSKEVEQLKNYENCLLSHYKKLIDSISVFLKADVDLPELKISLMQKACKLLRKFYYFNYSEELSHMIVGKINNPNTVIRQMSYDCLNDILSKVENNTTYLELKLRIINTLTHIFFNTHESKLEEKSILLLSSHKVEFPEVQRKKKQSKIEKEVQREVNEYESQVSLGRESEVVFDYNLKILKKILLVYLEFLTNRSDSKFNRYILDCISKQAENINVEILIDLQKSIYRYIDNKLGKLKEADKDLKLLNSKNSKKKNEIVEISNKDKEATKHREKSGVKIILTCVSALKACIIIKEKLTKEIISVEDSYLLNSVYYLLDKVKPLINSLEVQDLVDIMELIEHSIVKNRQFSAEVTCSFIKRITILIKCIENEQFAFPFLIMLKHILDLYPNCSGIIDDEEFDNFDEKINDPNLANGRQTTIRQELSNISKKGPLTKRVVEQIITRKSIINKEYINYYDLLLKLK